MEQEQRFDAVVIGSGAAGLTAATVAAKLGLKVLVLEKAGVFGGTTALSGGGLWIPGNPRMEEVGQPDDMADAEHYLRNVLGADFDEALVRAFLENGPEMIHFLEANSYVRFDACPMPDYEATKPGARAWRSLFTRDYDGRRLGSRLKDLRLPKEELTFAGIQLNFVDTTILLKFARSLASVVHGAKLFGRYVIDKIRFGQATRLVNGNALAGSLLHSAIDAGVTLWSSSRAIELLEKDAAVRGVVVEREGTRCTVEAEFGVVLASGGYGGNDEMRRRFMPLAAAGRSNQPKECVGDGIAMGERLGGKLINNEAANATWVPVSIERTRDGERVFPHVALDRHFPGAIAVNVLGERFANEALDYHNFGKVMVQLGVDRCYLIVDHAFLKRYGIGMVRPAPFPFGRHVRSGYLVSGNSLGELADKLGLPPENLEKTVERYNANARQGSDPDFHRGEDALSAAMGDPEHQPNPNVGPIEQGPFYSITLLPGELCSVNGLQTDACARVLDGAGKPIAGLYAAGIDSNPVFRGHYPGGGSSIGPAMTFGFIAANSIAQTADIWNMGNTWVGGSEL